MCLYSRERGLELATGPSRRRSFKDMCKAPGSINQAKRTRIRSAKAILEGENRTMPRFLRLSSRRPQKRNGGMPEWVREPLRGPAFTPTSNKYTPYISSPNNSPGIQSTPQSKSKSPIGHKYSPTPGTLSKQPLSSQVQNSSHILLLQQS